MSDFKDVILKLRNSKSLSQQELAKELGVSKSSVAMWETGKRFPSREISEQIADLFNVDIDYLYGRTDVPKKIHFDIYGNKYEYVEQSTIYDRIKKSRLESGLTLLQVANSLNVTEATVQRYESGEIKNIKHETIIKLAEILNCSPAYLMGWIVDKSPINSTSSFVESNNHNSDLLKRLAKYHEAYTQLNNAYKEQADEFISYLLAKQNKEKYKNTVTDFSDSMVAEPTVTYNTSSTLKAAHEIPGATEEEKQHDYDIMTDDSEWE